MRIAFFDEATGDLVADSGVLYGCDMEAQGDASVEFVDGVGLKLKIGPNSEGYVSYYSASSWVQNPFEGSASVRDGKFAADGDLAGLPWEVTSDEGGVTAFLPSSVFSGWFDLHVIPTGLGDPTGDLTMSLREDSRADARSYLTKTVPEFGNTAGLLGIALGAVGWRTRKLGRRSVPSRGPSRGR